MSRRGAKEGNHSKNPEKEQMSRLPFDSQIGSGKDTRFYEKRLDKWIFFSISIGEKAKLVHLSILMPVPIFLVGQYPTFS